MARMSNVVQLDNMRIVFRNFNGRKMQYNQEGDRNFAVVFKDQDLAQRLADEGYNVKFKPPREEGELPFMFLKVKLKYNSERPGSNPSIYLRSGSNMVLLNEQTVGCLDDITIDHVDLDIRPYDYIGRDGTPGRTAYLQSMMVVQVVNRFASEFEAMTNHSDNKDDIQF